MGDHAAISISDEELTQWAENRADDAGRLARELIQFRRSAASFTPIAKQALADIESCLDDAVSYLVDLASAKPDENSTQNCRSHIEQARFYARRLAALEEGKQ